MLTYALGRGLEYRDVETVDRLVERIETAKAAGPRPCSLGIVESVAIPEDAGRIASETRQRRQPDDTAGRRQDRSGADS